MTIPFIDLKKQYLEHKNKFDEALQRVLAHGQYIMGPEVAELESQLAEYIGVRHALTCSSGTDALLMPLMTQSLTRKDAVFTTPFTFFASAEAITLAGATPVFVDIDPDTYNINPSSLEVAICKVLDAGEFTPRAVLSVDLFGLSCDYDRISSISQKYGLFLLEDAAQSFAAKYKNKRACSLGDVGATSFYPAKPLGCYGDGGAVFTNNKDMFENLQSIRVHGQAMNGDKYDNVRIGLNARMDTLQAAILIPKLALYESEVASRNAVANKYSNFLDSHIKTPYVPEDCESVWAQYSIQVANRDQVRTELQANGIPTAVFYPTPIHLSTAYRELGYKRGDLPVSESISTRILSLPMHPYLEESQIESICAIINRTARK